MLIAGIITLVALIVLGWWLLIETEGVYLGRRVVILLYDLYARRYDRIKAFEPEFDFALLAVPIMNAIEPHRTPLVLDVATGTGRLPKALLNHARFNGHIIGIDLSRRMLHQAAENLAENSDWVDLMHAPAENLPFVDASFDVVSCLEALEFVSDLEAVLQEMVRVLRPGGVLLVTNRINTRWMPGRTYDSDAFELLLAGLGMCNVYIEPWQIDYQRVWARKPGTFVPSEAVPLHSILRCPCGGERLDVELSCQQCGRFLQGGSDGILEWMLGSQQRQDAHFRINE